MTILEKIKALLAKAASTTNANEAEVFAAKANELMEKYQIDIDAIRASDDPVGKDKAYATKAKATTWQMDAASATAQYYGCRAIRSRRPEGCFITIFGRESARITAMEMLPYFIKTINVYAREMSKQLGWDSYKCAKQIGQAFAARLQGLAPKMEQANSVVTGKNALIRLDEINALVEATFPHLSRSRERQINTSAAAQAYAGRIGLAGQMGSRSSLRIGG